MKKKPTAYQIFQRKRDALLPALAAFERENGKELARSAMAKHIKLAHERENRQEEIAKLKRELKKLSRNKLP